MFDIPAKTLFFFSCNLSLAFLSFIISIFPSVFLLDKVPEMGIM